MKRVLDILIFLGFLSLLAIVHQGLGGISFQASPPDAASFEASLQVKDVLYSAELAPKVAGYGGAIPLAIGVDEQGVIRDIHFFKNAETPEFFQEALDSGITAHWIGRPLEEAQNVQVDAVSGATLSSQGIIKTVQTSLRQYLGQEQVAHSLSQADWMKAISIACVGVMALLLFLFPRQMKKLRLLIATASVIVLGLWQGTMLSLAKISAWLLGGLPRGAELTLGIIFLLSLLLPMLTGRNFYCYHLCPFGAAQDLVAQSFSFKLKIKIHKFFHYTRLVMLMLCFILLILGLGASVANVEPFAAFKPQYAPLSAVIIFSVALLLSIFIPRAWCRFFCPCGAFLDLFKWTRRAKK